MEKKVFEESVKIRYSEVDHDMVLKPSVLLNFLQDLASDNAEMLGFGYSYIVKNNLAWFLLKYHMEFEDYPANLYELTIKTEPRGYNKLFAFRDFEIYSGNNLLGRATSTWSLVDINSKSLVPVVSALNNNYMVPFEKRENDLVYEKIPPIKKIDIEKTFEIRFDDIDVNKHANNANYITWAFEPLGYNFRTSKKLKSLDLVYKKEVKYGNTITSVVEISGNTTNHLVKNGDNDLCMILAKWTDK